MTKDELKNRISMALKSPILQQGFEIICKNLAELKKENAELKRLKRECETSLCRAEYQYNYEQLTKAKEIIKMLHSDCYSIAECEDTNLGQWEDDLAKAEQFLNNEVENDR